jgi:acyl-CoA synthetase (AMP-forming)/AMP-acid ligase II
LIQPVLLAQLADTYPEDIAWKNLADGSMLTLGDWHGQSNRLARGLRHRGLDPGDRVALALAPEDPFEWLISYMAVHKAGCVAVPINTRLSPPEMGRIFRHAGTAALLVSQTVRAGLDPSNLPVGMVATLGADATMLSWHDLLDDDAGDLGHQIENDDVADIMYTSGTTGAPKGVVVRHGGLSASDRVPPSWYGLGFITASPFSTTSGSLLVCGPMRGGLSGWFLPRFDPGHWLNAVTADRPVAGFLVPAMVQLLVAHAAFPTADLSGLAVLTIGSAPISEATLRRFAQRLPSTDIMCGYGMTEFGAVTATPPGDRGAHLGSVGLPLPGVQVQISDGTGGTVATGEVGEIVIRGARTPRTALDAEDDSGTLGWLHTGDLGSLDDDGFVWIVGRQKDMVIRGGHNVMPGEVEAVLFEHPDVTDAAVAGVVHEVLGEDVAAWVVVRPGGARDPESLRRFMLKRLADYKVPRRITFVDALPRNEAGKVVKAALVPADQTEEHS